MSPTRNPTRINQNVHFYAMDCLIRRLTVVPVDITAIRASLVCSSLKSGYCKPVHSLKE